MMTRDTNRAAFPHGWATLMVAETLGQMPLSEEAQRAMAHVIDCDTCLDDLGALLDADPVELLLAALIPALAREELSNASLTRAARAHLADYPRQQGRLAHLRELAVLDRLGASAPERAAIAGLALRLLDAALLGDRDAVATLDSWGGAPGRRGLHLREVIERARRSPRASVAAAARDAARAMGSVTDADAYAAATAVLSAHGPLMLEQLGIGWHAAWTPPAPTPDASGHSLVERVRVTIAALELQPRRVRVAFGGAFVGGLASGEEGGWSEEVTRALLDGIEAMRARSSRSTDAAGGTAGTATVQVGQRSPSAPVTLRLVTHPRAAASGASRVTLLLARGEEVAWALRDARPEDWIARGMIEGAWARGALAVTLAHPSRLLTRDEQSALLEALEHLAVIWG